VTLAFDTDVFVYAADAGAGTRHTMASELMERAVRSCGAVLILQTLAEFYSVVTRRSLADPGEARLFLDVLRRVLPVHAVVEQDLDRAIEAVTHHGLSFWDALLWATADRAGVHYLLSEDFQDRRRLGGVTFVNPFDEANRRLIERALPPRSVPPT
jgi:predicted nucleic acid-binding protein